MPLDLAVVSHSSNGHARTVLYGREFVGIAPWGAQVKHYPGSLDPRPYGNAGRYTALRKDHILTAVVCRLAGAQHRI